MASFVCILLLGIKPPSYTHKRNTLEQVNHWVYDSMKLYYYWSDEMPAHPDFSLPTAEFFGRLLSVNDRFSSITYGRLNPPKTTGERFGFQYALINHPFHPQQLAGVITQVVPDSYAVTMGLTRGLFFTAVNGQGITASNMAAINHALSSGSSVQLTLAKLNNTGTKLVDSATVHVPYAFVPQVSVYGYRIYKHAKPTTGYLAYFLCAEKDDPLLLQRIGALRAARVNDLILDLRYNPGGSVASVSKLAAALIRYYTPSAPFITYKGNHHGGTVKLSFEQAIGFSMNSIGKDRQYLQQINLGLRRIFILTSRATASAAELLANNLRSYMHVTLIGEQTRGKDEASFVIEDKRYPWKLMPTVYKVANAQGRGNYSNGLKPDHIVNEFSRLPLQELGLPGDVPVDKALELIYGEKRPLSRSFNGQPLFYSLQSGLLPMAAPM